MNHKQNKILNLLPVQTAADTIRSFCLGFELCEKIEDDEDSENFGKVIKCPFYDLQGRGCYFTNFCPDKWNVNELINKKTEELVKTHKVQRRKKNQEGKG